MNITKTAAIRILKIKTTNPGSRAVRETLPPAAMPAPEQVPDPSPNVPGDTVRFR
ncbi:MAG TPA: hypothetical protein GX704_04360 [Clostridiales bacterium]|nr:hypothetical protein [Clostridiales bacterium]